MNDFETMDLPINFPPGTRFWQLTIDGAADLTNGEFMFLDGSIVSGQRAEQLRQRIAKDGVEISEDTFREMAPPQQAQLLAEFNAAVKKRADIDPEFAKHLAAAIIEQGLLAECERVARDCLQNDPDPHGSHEATKLLLEIIAKRQNVADQ
jgi:hypothetical protein